MAICKGVTSHIPKLNAGLLFEGLWYFVSAGRGAICVCACVCVCVCACDDYKDVKTQGQKL